jgi:DNA (cytosine-5)-methyltransferase 1
MRKVMGTPAWRDRDLPHLRPTVADCAALQGFRPSLRFAGGQGQQFLQAGNAVAVPFAAAVISAAANLAPTMQLEVAA